MGSSHEKVMLEKESLVCKNITLKLGDESPKWLLLELIYECQKCHKRFGLFGLSSLDTNFILD